MQEQQSDQCELPAAAEAEDVTVDDLERAEDTKLHFSASLRRP